MNCRETLTMLSGYMDSELDLVRRLEVERHLQTCAECSSCLHEGQAVQTALRSELLYHAAPAGLDGRVLGAVRAAEKAQQCPTRRFLRPAFGIAAFAATLPVLWLLFAQGLHARRQEALTHQVVCSHVHSLMATHLLDVTSSDPGVVKPWLSAKLDYMPSVVDLKAQSYALLGGRLDYLDDHPVAALVYARRNHLVNLFLWPSTEPPSQAMSLESRHGYRLCGWTAGGMTYWAVSDESAPEMTYFAESVQARTTALGDLENCK